jgi:hypothetical protein
MKLGKLEKLDLRNYWKKEDTDFTPWLAGEENIQLLNETIGIEIELYRIGDSLPAPMFNIVSKPNDWAKSVKKSAGSQNITDTKLLQQQYWLGLKNFMEDNKSFVRIQSPQPQHWTNAALGRSNFHLSATVNSREKTISIWLNITGSDAKENYEKLYEKAFGSSQKEISEEIIWDVMEGRKMSCVILKTAGDINLKSDWPNQFQWFKTYLEKFTRYFKPYIKNL